MPFNLMPTDLVIPDVCPVLGIPLDTTVGHRHNGTASVDRIIPDRGYVSGNVAVISWRANRLKSDATTQEIVRLAEYVKEREDRWYFID